MTRFKALELSLEVIRALRPCLTKLRARDPKLAEQMRAAASSVALKLSEGRKRSGKDRRHHWRVASGSADEVLTALRVAEAWGEMENRDIVGAVGLLDQLLAVLWRLTN